MEGKNDSYTPMPFRRYVVILDTDPARQALLCEQMVKLGFVPLVATSMLEGIALAAAHGLQMGSRSIITETDQGSIG